jgi:hypothetical protein
VEREKLTANSIDHHIRDHAIAVVWPAALRTAARNEDDQPAGEFSEVLLGAGCESHGEGPPAD